MRPRTREYNPDKWALIKFTKNDGQIWYKVLGGWSGGYLDGDSWRLSSGVETVTKDDKKYLVKNYSGSVYVCHEGAEGFNFMSGGIFSQMKEEGKDHGVEVEQISIEQFEKEILQSESK